MKKKFLVSKMPLYVYFIPFCAMPSEYSIIFECFHLLPPCNFLRIIKEKCIRCYNANVPVQQLYRAFSLPFPASEEETDSMLSVIALLSIPKGVLQTGQKAVNYTELHILRFLFFLWYLLFSITKSTDFKIGWLFVVLYLNSLFVLFFFTP